MQFDFKNKIKDLITLTRVEFLPANSASVLIGFAWAINRGFNFDLKAVGLVLSLFVVLSAVGTLGAHWNSYSDADLDALDPTKKDLRKSMADFSRKSLKKVILFEVILATILFLAFLSTQKNWVLMGLWLIAILLAFSYSMPPARFKAKGILAFLSLCLVLSILPIVFVHLTFNRSLDWKFLLFLAGHTLVIYSLIIPTEIRDYLVDRTSQVRSMTVWLGLKRIIVLAQILLACGSAMIVWSYLNTGVFTQFSILKLSLLVVLGCNTFVMINFHQLRKLINTSRDIENHPDPLIRDFAMSNPKWITISSMGSMLAALVMVIGKIVLT